MPKIEPFERFAAAYDAWFDVYPWAFQSEVEAVRRFWPAACEGLEVGVGTGRFAEALGIRWGVEPSAAMRAMAGHRGIEALDGVAEALPFGDERFDALLMVTTLCFLDDPDRALDECRRVLKPSGLFVAGFVDARSELGRRYAERRGESRFYGEALFWSVPEVVAALMRRGFSAPAIVQTLFGPLDSMRETDPVKPGYGEGAFVVLAAAKRANREPLQKSTEGEHHDAFRG
ncbi:MAG: class I SAM-dependent methyltransferase [Acidobacteriota bacterium]